MSGSHPIHLTNEGLLQWPQLLRSHGCEVSRPTVKQAEHISFFYVRKESVAVTVVQHVDCASNRNELYFRPTGDEGKRQLALWIKAIIHDAGLSEDCT